MDPAAESTHSNDASSDGKLSSPVTENQKDRTPYIDPVIEKRLVRKLDVRMLLWSFLAYFANLLDRNNLRTFYHFFLFWAPRIHINSRKLIYIITIENAFTMGMREDLDLNSAVYNWAVTMFFIGYIVYVYVHRQCPLIQLVIV